MLLGEGLLVYCLAFFVSIGSPWERGKPELKMTEFAQSSVQWTGIAISKNDRVFVSFPNWSKEKHIAVAEIIDNSIVPYPNKEWNDETQKIHFVCVQSVYADVHNNLWILDTGYEPETDSTQGAYLYCFDLNTNNVKEKYYLSASRITGKSYLNDFRIDHKRQVAYFTDSQVGGIVTLNLKTKEIRRVLAQHPSTLTEVEKITIEGYERKHPVHSDGIELDSENEYLYYCSLMGKNVYRIPTSKLLDKDFNDIEMGKLVEIYASTGANDGIIFDRKGNLYLSSLEKNAISVVNRKKEVRLLIADEKIRWPDSFAFDSKGSLYFTISQIHLPNEKRGMYKIYKLAI